MGGIQEQVPNEGWTEVSLSEICDPHRKITYGIVQPGQLHAEGIPIVRVNNFRGNALDLTDRLAVAPEIEEKYVRSRPKAGDLLISLVGTIGQLAIAPAEIAGWNLARAVGLIPFSSKLTAEWTFYSLQTAAAQEFIHQRANTTVQTTFNLKDLANIPVFLPPEWEQRQVLSILKTLDDKIELNRQMNQTLEALARAVFEDWFVDFGPTRRKMAGETDPAAILGGLLPPATATPLAPLFPDQFGENGLPLGWEERKIESILVRLKVGKLYDQKSAHVSGKVPILDQGKQGIIGFHNDEPNVRANKEARVAVFANHTCVQRLLDFDFSTIQNVIPYVGNQLPIEWCHYATLGKQAFEEYKGHWPTFVARAVVVPSSEIAQAFARFVDPHLQMISQNEQENQTLAATRDLLLPKLMSGELRLVGGAHG